MARIPSRGHPSRPDNVRNRETGTKTHVEFCLELRGARGLYVEHIVEHNIVEFNEKRVEVSPAISEVCLMYSGERVAQTISRICRRLYGYGLELSP